MRSISSSTPVRAHRLSFSRSARASSRSPPPVQLAPAFPADRETNSSCATVAASVGTRRRRAIVVELVFTRLT